MLKKVLTGCCMVLLLSTVEAQLYPFTEFNTKNGLINNRCGNISQDSAGYIWIGTDNGICNYDGRKFNFFPGYYSTYYFGHSFPTMYKGQCLLGTYNSGLVKCVGNKTSFIMPASKKQMRILSGLALDDSSYLLGRYGDVNTLLYLKGTTEKELEVPAAISSRMTGILVILEDIEKNIWVGTDVGFFIYLKGDLTRPYVIPELLNKYCNCIKEDFDHNIFVTCSGGAYKIDRNQLKTAEQIKPAIFYQTAEQIPALGFFNNGDILLGQMTAGVKIFSKTLQWKKDIKGENGLNNTVWDIFTDREGNTWFATENGLLRLRNAELFYFPSPASASTNIKSGLFYQNSFLFSNGSQILELNNEKMYGIDDYKNVPGYLIQRMLVTPDQQLWINSYPDNEFNSSYVTYEYIISKRKAVKKRNILAAFHLNSPVNMQQVVNVNGSSMLFLTEKKTPYLYEQNKVLQCMYDTTAIPVSLNVLSSSHIPDEIWLANNDKGIYRCRMIPSAGSCSLQLIQHIPFTFSQPPVCKKMLSDKKGNIWLATSNMGILKYQHNGNGYAFSSQVSFPVISSELINDVLLDQSGDMWIGSNNGIDKVAFNREGTYTVSKGLFDNVLTGHMIYFLKERNDQLYVGTTGSIAVINIKSVEKKVTPIVHINHIAINNINADSLLVQRQHQLQPDENNISFEFVSPSFINEKQTAYQYKLEGADTSWSSTSSNFTITYNQLKPGSYTFRVRARNADNVWSEKDAVFSFIIKKPFYKHWAFYLLCLGICCGFIYWLYRQRIAGILAVEKTRQRISKDLHDDIGSTLSSITLMNAVLKNKIEKKPGEAIQLAEKIEDTSRQMIQNMSDIVWSINPGNDTMDKMQNRLQQFCADVFEDTETRHKLTISEALLKQSLPMELRRDVYLICKELTNNAAKYSKAANYTLVLFLDKKDIGIVAIDDGIGFNNNSIKKGNGINNIQQRVAANNGTVIMETVNGTKWTISIPIR